MSKGRYGDWSGTGDIDRAIAKQNTKIVEALPDFCPKCGEHMSTGYGLAGGSGMGAYALCEQGCLGIFKVLDPE
jgi:hypothetical protein